jgi:hypothetical protein
MMDMDRIREEMDRQRDEMDRTFGHRPRGQEHRAWIEHDWLRGLVHGSREWKTAMSYLGLDQLPVDDPALPAPLRTLLVGPSIGVVNRVVPVAVTAGALAGVWLVYAVVGDLTALVGALPGMAVGVALSIPLSALLGEDEDARREAMLRERVAAELDALEAAPFLRQIGSLLVENLPVHAQLGTWTRELHEAREEAGRRASRMEELETEMKAARARLGEAGRDATLEALAGARRSEAALIERIDRLLPRLQARHAELEARVGALRDRAKLARLRGEAQELVGDGPSDTPLQIGAALEIGVELQELRAEMEAIRAEVREEERRLKAAGEVARV